MQDTISYTLVIYFRDLNSLGRGFITSVNKKSVFGFRPVLDDTYEIKGAEHESKTTFAALIEIRSPEQGTFQDHEDLIEKMFIVRLPLEQAIEILSLYGPNVLFLRRSHHHIAKKSHRMLSNV
ncbi:MAG: hypothetical protein P4L74_07300 [Candidatus Doudnabacteria bacterium]|nr:hypothetical protein [Candidatus Doudnabacteria bacterium]